MNKIVKEVLQELYQVDNSLQQYEKKLIKIIEKMIKLKPQVEIDLKFKANLKNELLLEIERMKQTSRTPLVSSLSILFSPKNWAYFTTGVVMTAAVFMVISQDSENKQVKSFVADQQLNSSENNSPRKWIEQESANKMLAVTVSSSWENSLFGKLGGGDGDGDQPMMMNSRGAGAALGSAVLESSTMMMENAPAADMIEEIALEDEAVSSPEPMLSKIAPIDYVPKVYQYVYQGELPKLEEQMMVYKKVTQPFQFNNVASLLNKLNIKDIDFSQWQNLSIDSLSLRQEGKPGYSFYINFEEGRIDIHKLYDRSYGRMEEKPGEKEIEKPSDDEVLVVADKFIRKLGADVSSYGQPVVKIDENHWLWAEWNARMYFSPNRATVTYPWLIEGEKVYEEYGNGLAGIVVSIDLNSMTVDYVDGLEQANFQSSLYVTQQDQAQIREALTKGYISHYDYQPENAEIIEVEVNKPEIKLIRKYWYDGEKDTILLVPAYVFTVKQNPQEGEYYRQEIVIPVIKDFYEKREDDVRIMPLMEPAIMK